MRAVAQVLLATLSMAVPATNSAHALFGPADKSYAPSGNWDVGFQQNIGPKGVCFAHTNYESGKIQVWIGSRLQEEDNKRSWFLGLYNKD
jgi:hypothetical protein